MRTILAALLGVCLAAPLTAQDSVEIRQPCELTPAELDELFGPIALYPDALIARILPALRGGKASHSVNQAQLQRGPASYGARPSRWTKLYKPTLSPARLPC